MINPLMEKIKLLLESQPLLGWVVAFVFLLFAFLSFIVKSIPQWDILKSRILIPIAKKWKHKKLVREAIKSDIIGHVNYAAVNFQKEFPEGWFNKTEIQWVEHESKEDFLDDEEVVIRMRPLEDQNQNYLTALYYFIKKSIFPKTKKVIPSNYFEASALYLSKKTVEAQKPALSTLFEDCILEPRVERQKSILQCFEKYDLIDNRGFYASFFLREAYEIAKKYRFSQQRVNIGIELSDVLKHAENFISGLGKIDKIPDRDWYHQGKLSSFGFILVADPSKATGSLKPYIERAKEKLELEIQRLYIFGTEKERWFGEYVVKAICKELPKYKLTERFDLYSDYRKNKGGFGAVFVLR